MEQITETTTEVLYFTNILVKYTDEQGQFLLLNIPRWYMNASFATRRAAIKYFKTHRTSIVVRPQWEKYLTYRARCVHRRYGRYGVTGTCNFHTQDVETTLRHAPHHTIDETIGDRPVRLTRIPRAQDDTKRHLFRQHLFGHRLATLCKYERVPVFNKTTHLTERMYYFNERQFTIIFSRDDPFTEKYMKLLRPLVVCRQSLFNVTLLTNDQVATMLNTLTSLTDGFQKTIFQAFVSSVSGLVGVLANISILFTNPTPYVAFASVVSILAHIAPHVVPDISWFERPVQQSSMTWIPSAISLMLMAVLGAANLSASAGLSIFKKATSLGFTLASVGGFHRIFSEAWREMFPYIYEAMFGEAPGLEECLGQLPDFQALIKRVERFNKDERYKHIMTSQPACEEVEAMHREMTRLFELADRTKLRGAFTPAIRSYQKDINEWRAKVQQSAFRVSGTRIEPVVIHMFGESGVGKSAITHALAMEIMKGDLDFETYPSLSNHIYTRNAASEFWAGYNGQPIVVFDDFMQKRDSDSSPNPEVFEVIQSANNAPFLVPMADLSEKANSYFTSKLMILTSNVESLEPKSITHPAALQRRMDLVVKVMRDRQPPANGSFDTSVYDFCIMLDKNPGPLVNFEQLVTIAREKREIKKNANSNYKADMEARQAAPAIQVPIDQIPDIDRIVGQPSDMTSCKVPMKQRPIKEGLRDWLPQTPWGAEKERCMHHLASTLLSQAISFDDIYEHDGYKFFQGDAEELEALRATRMTIGTRPCAEALWKETFPDGTPCFYPEDTVDLDEYATFVQKTTAYEKVKEAASARGLKMTLQTYYEVSAMKYIKKLFAKSTFMSIIVNTILSNAQKIKDFTTRNATTIATGTVTGVLSYLLFNLLKWLWNRSAETKPVEDDRTHTESWDHQGRTPALRGNVRGVRVESWDHQGKTPLLRGAVRGARPVRNGDIDPASSSIVTRIISQTAAFYATADSGKQCGTGTFFIGRCCFLNLHVLDDLAESDRCYVILPGAETRVPFDWKDLVLHRHPEIDLAMIEFPPSVRDFKDITKHIAEEADIKFQQNNVRVPLRRKNNFEVMNIRGQVMNTTLVVGSDPTVAEEDDENIEVKGYIRYQGGSTVAGDCGALVVVCDPRMPRKVCGMHVAGQVDAGFAFLLVREHVDYLLAEASPSSKLRFQPPQAEPTEKPVIQGCIEPLGTVEAVFEPTKTSIRKSEIHGLFPLTKVPAVLRPVEGCDPLVKGALNFGRDPGYVSVEEMESCKESLKAAMFPGVPTITRTLTIEEAVFGIPGIIEPMKTDTSPGYPWCLENHPEPGKRHWIQPGFIHQDLRSAVAQIRADALSRIISPTIFKDTLKDERRKLSRCDRTRPENIKTRVFAASPMHLVICLKMYFGAYFTHMQNQRIQNTTAIGINPYSVEWHQIVMKLREVSHLANDGDYENFDTTQPPAFIDASFEVAREWYEQYGGTKEDDIIREVLGRHITHAIHMCRGELYRVSGKNPSGTYGTTQINSCSNLCAFQYAWDKIFPNNAGAVEFHRNVRMITNGDDVIFAVRKQFSDFTIAAISEQLARINMKITPALKEGTFIEARPIEECTFLKRGFRLMKGFYRGPLDIETCKDMTQWTRKSDDNLAATIENCKISAMELGITEPTGETRNQLAAALMKLGHYVPLPTTREVLQDHAKFY